MSSLFGLIWNSFIFWRKKCHIKNQFSPSLSTKMTMNDNIAESNENFLKKILKDFYHKIIETEDFNTFEDISIKWIKDELENHDKNPENFLKMMQHHKKHQIWFTSIMGFFYQHGIGCYVNRNMSLELYLLIINNVNNLKNNQLHLIKENGSEVNKLQVINTIIGRYLLSLFYYKDIILVKSNKSNNKFENFRSIFTKKNFIKNIVKRDDGEFDNRTEQQNENTNVKIIIEDNNVNTLISQVNTNVKNDNINMVDYNQSNKANYKKDFESIKKSAISGDAEAQNELGCLYLEGKEVYRSKRKAFEWFLKSANNGCSSGQSNLGWHCYFNGIGTDKDKKKAFEWFLKSAESGSTTGQSYLGDCYLNGKGVDKNEKKAFELFLKSAEGGSTTGQYHLGDCYLKGKGIDKNERKAFEWFLKSAEGGSTTGQSYLGDCYLNGKGVDKNEKKAFELFLKSAEGGSTTGQYHLGDCYLKGKGIDKNERKAFEWFLKSAEGGSLDGQNYLGYCYLNGKGVNKNEKKAFELFLKSANKGSSLGQYYLGYCYEKGIEINKNIKDAIRWYEIALGNGRECARRKLIKLKRK